MRLHESLPTANYINIFMGDVLGLSISNIAKSGLLGNIVSITPFSFYVENRVGKSYNIGSFIYAIVYIQSAKGRAGGNGCDVYTINTSIIITPTSNSLDIVGLAFEASDSMADPLCTILSSTNTITINPNLSGFYITGDIICFA